MAYTMKTDAMSFNTLNLTPTAMVNEFNKQQQEAEEAMKVLELRKI